jgi:hypothetical protein
VSASLERDGKQVAAQQEEGRVRGEMGRPLAPAVALACGHEEGQQTRARSSRQRGRRDSELDKVQASIEGWLT